MVRRFIVAVGAVLCGGLGTLVMAQSDTLQIIRATDHLVKWTDARGGQRMATVNQTTGHISRYAYDNISCGIFIDFDLDGMNTVVCHYNENYFSSKRAGTQFVFTDVFQGKYHAKNRVSFYFPHFNIDTGVQTPDMLKVTFDYFFCTGWNQFLVAYTFDTGKMSPFDGMLSKYDTRSPYNEIDWNGNGARDRDSTFIQWQAGTDALITLENAADSSFTRSFNNNRVAFARMWDQHRDREMGMVATENYLDKPMGKEWFDSTHRYVAATSGKNPGQYPFQFNSFQAYKGERMSWASQWVIGKNSSRFNGMTIDGYPYYDYSVMMLLGRYSWNSMMNLVREQEHYNTALISSISGGTVATQGPGGPGDSTIIAWKKAGYNPVYRTWEMTAELGPLTFTFTADTISNPTFVVHNYTADAYPVAITVNTIKAGAILVNSTDYYASVDKQHDELYVTFKHTFTGPNNITITAPSSAVRPPHSTPALWYLQIEGGQNPFAKTATIAFIKQIPQPVSVAIYSVNGALIKNMTDVCSGTGRHTLQLGTLKGGYYFVDITLQGKHYWQKLLAI